MADDRSFIVPQSVGGMPLAGEPPKSKPSKLFGNPMKVIGWIVLLILLVISAVHWKSTSGHSWSSRAATHETYPTEDNSREVTLTTEWSSWVYNRHDAGLNFDFHTPDLWWQVDIDGHPYLLAPINAPGSDMFKPGSVHYKMRVRIAPANECPENTGKKLEGTGAFYYKPA